MRFFLNVAQLALAISMSPGLRGFVPIPGLAYLVIPAQPAISNGALSSMQLVVFTGICGGLVLSSVG